MKGTARRNLAFVIALCLAVLAAGHVSATAAGQRSARHRQKLDLKLRAALDAGQRDAQRVIVRTRAGQRESLQRALAAHGDQVLAEHGSIDAFTAVVHGDDLDVLTAQDGVISVSTDAVVEAELLGGLLGGLLNLTSSLVEVVGDVVGLVLLPNGADTSGPAVYPEMLRETLALSGRWSGRGIGVAVIDSGLDMSSEFRYRVRGFYDFTRGGRATRPYDDYGHGTHVASTIGGSGALSSNRDYHGIAPGWSSSS